MTERSFVYRCESCGHIVEVLNAGAPTLTCCGQKMGLLTEKTADSSTEKHVPFIEKIDGGYKVKVGETTAHPMMDAHFIQWIELLTDKGSYKHFLKPNDAPEAIFMVANNETVIAAREYCNLHGHWKFEK